MVAVAGLVAQGLHDLDACQIGFKFIGHHHREAGAHTLAHLGAMTDHRDYARGINRDKHQRIVHQSAGHAVTPVLDFLGCCGSLCKDVAGATDSQDQTTGAHAFEPSATGRVFKVEDVVHDLAPN